tara:strand:+ start:33 stop:1967 length:1935 start_codon:yes stop_codon:yes gene_type:complete
MTQRFIPFYLKQSISRKLIFLILIFSSIITLILTATQLWLEFDAEVSEIESRLIDIDKSFSQTITQQIWNLDREQMETTADGLFQLPYVDLVVISGSEIEPVIRGNISEVDQKSDVGKVKHIKLEKDLYYESEDTLIGHLTVSASLEPVYTKLFNKILITLFNQGIKTFLVSIFMLVVFNLVVVKHLVELAKLVDGLTSENLNEAKLLKISSDSGDEIDTVISSINLMITRLKENYNDLKDSELALKLHQAQLEEIVEKRTSQLRSAKLSAEKANEAKSLFLASMSHELRTPLNSIILLSKLLSKNTDSNLTEEQIKKAMVINSSGTELLNLVTDLLDLSKIEAGKMILDFDDFKLKEVLINIELLFKPVANQKGVDFRVEYQDDFDLKTDREKLNQILNNIVGNAIKFTPKGSVVIKVFKTQSDDKGEYCVEVCDTGIGMSEAEKEHIFNVFQQANNKISSEFGGTGLGLAICKKLCELLSIEIEIESTLNQGSTFRLYIPSPKQIEHKIINAEVGDLKLLPDTENLKVAIIDDDKRSLTYLEHLLDKENINVDSYLSAHDFLLATENNLHWNIIIIDLYMPDINGFELLAKIKEKNIDSRLILLTGQANVETKRKASELGFDSFISKPINLELLKQEINRLA